MIPPMKRTFACVLVLFVFRAVVATAAIPEPVRTDLGLVSGAGGVNDGVRVFKGIPYAAPPVGDLRWKPPQPPAHWDGVRAATTFGANCMQRNDGGGAFPPYGGDRSATSMSEDCLYLNVYTAAAAANARQPVMVWIHGGAFTSGAGAIYQGEDLARKGVVVVTINYRLGVFGFLAHPELTAESPRHASGNYALLDQIAALTWVRKNIGAFGGNPESVTIFGESAGSWSVNALVASPLAKGLFDRAIGESGGRFAASGTHALTAAEAEGRQFAESAGAGSLAALRAVPGATLSASRDFDTSLTIDGWSLPHDVATIFRNGMQNDVPVLIGSNANEGSIFAPERTTAASMRESFEKRYGDASRTLLGIYPIATDRDARVARAASMRDEVFGWEMRTWARLQTSTGSAPVYLYYFSRVPPLEDAAWLGAQHGAEIPYAFDWPNGRQSQSVSWTAIDRRRADHVSSYWVNFAKTGNPNGAALPQWKPYNARADQAMGFGDTPAMIPVPNTAALDFFDAHPGR
jgi:para-nitrobenzyl esterase